MHSLIFTFLGEDRPGVVESLAAQVAAHGGNWLESRMAHLGGQFAGLVRVELPAQNVEALAAILADGPDGLRVTVHHGAATAPASARRTARLEIIGHDRPGIVSQISRCLASRGVNVEEFSSEIRSAPMTGEPLFAAEATVSMPEAAEVSDLRSALETIAADLMVEIVMV